MKKVPIIFFFLFFLYVGFGLSYEKFMVFNHFEEAFRLAETLNKGLIILFASEDCQYCDIQRSRVFSENGISALLRNNFIVLQIDRTYEYSGHFNISTAKPDINSPLYTYIEIFGLFEVKGTPSTAFYSRKMKYLGTIPGLLFEEELKKVIKFVSQEIFVSKDYESYDAGLDKFEGYPTVYEISLEDADFVLSMLGISKRWDYDSFNKLDLSVLDKSNYYLIFNTSKSELEGFLNSKGLKFYNIYSVK